MEDLFEINNIKFPEYGAALWVKVINLELAFSPLPTEQALISRAKADNSFFYDVDQVNIFIKYLLDQELICYVPESILCDNLAKDQFHPISKKNALNIFHKFKALSNTNNNINYEAIEAIIFDRKNYLQYFTNLLETDSHINMGKSYPCLLFFNHKYAILMWVN